MKIKILLAPTVSFFVIRYSSFGQGALTPPGAPAPTMKSLDQIEARTPVDATHTPGDASNSFIISQSGSYYLTTNVFGTGGNKNGLSVQADNVTIDLNGFALIGVAGSQDGINVPATQHNLCIRNGTIRNWPSFGAAVFSASNSRYTDLRVSQNGSVGLSAGNNCTIEDCAAEQNGSSAFSVINGSAVIHCTSRYDTNGGMVILGSGCTVSGCTVQNNSSDGITVSASNCNVKDCTATGNGGVGIGAGFEGISVSGCVVRSNTGDGISAGNYCQIHDNLCIQNGNGIAGVAGIRVSGSNGRIENNHLVANALYGIKVDSSGTNNVVVRNSAHLNTGGDYNVATLVNDVGPVGQANSLSSPWGNIQH
jgi:parallel beta-helix repeat protein